jgi:hypothetical protein
LSTDGIEVRGSCGGGVDCRISPSTFWREDTGAVGMGSTILEEEEERRWMRRAAVRSPEVERPFVIGIAPLLGG